MRGRGRGRREFPPLRREGESESDSGSSSESDSDVESDSSDTSEELDRKTFTLKQLIRKLHITEPAEHVMCLIGKRSVLVYLRTGIFTLTSALSECCHRYPSTLDEFYKARLPGMFEEERADKRMKLPTPETWETQVSLKGNKASTWQDLIGQYFS